MRFAKAEHENSLISGVDELTRTDVEFVEIAQVPGPERAATPDLLIDQERF